MDPCSGKPCRLYKDPSHEPPFCNISNCVEVHFDGFRRYPFSIAMIKKHFRQLGAECAAVVKDAVVKNETAVTNEGAGTRAERVARDHSSATEGAPAGQEEADAGDGQVCEPEAIPVLDASVEGLAARASAAASAFLAQKVSVWGHAKEINNLTNNKRKVTQGVVRESHEALYKGGRATKTAHNAPKRGRGHESL
eukprot:1176104-Prorocentrum_minimum.AAC.7